MSSIVHEVYRRLYDAFGPQHWWPGDTPFEIMVGAVLTQNTNWKNVERAISNLRRADLLEPKALYATPLEELEEMIRPAGYFRIKARRLRNLLELVVKRYGGSLEKMFAADPVALRQQLLTVRGIGPETADSILLYAGGIAVFVIDAYTHRIFARHAWVEQNTDYHSLQEFFHSQLPDNAAMFNEYHALLVRLGKYHCHKRRPRCAGCPLQELLPPGGPHEGE